MDEVALWSLLALTLVTADFVVGKLTVGKVTAISKEGTLTMVFSTIHLYYFVIEIATITKSTLASQKISTKL